MKKFKYDENFKPIYKLLKYDKDCI